MPFFRSDEDSPDFESFYKQHFRAITRYVSRLVASPFVEDLVQEVFFNFWRASSSERVRPDGQILSYLYRIAHNRVANHHRAQRARPEIPWTDRANTVPAPSSPRDLDERQALIAAIMALPQPLHIVLVLHVEGVSCEEIAAMEGCAATAIRKRLQRAREALAHLHPAAAPSPFAPEVS